MELLVAIRNGDIERVRRLIAGAVDLNAGDEEGYTPLMVASGEGYPVLVKLLLDHGADPNVRDAYGNTALINACYAGHPEVAKLLIAFGADIDAQCDDGGTALAAAAWHGHNEIVLLLMLNGADADLRDLNGMTPVQHAWGEGRIDTARIINGFFARNTTGRDSDVSRYDRCDASRAEDMAEVVAHIEKLDVCRACGILEHIVARYGLQAAAVLPEDPAIGSEEGVRALRHAVLNAFPDYGSDESVPLEEVEALDMILTAYRNLHRYPDAEVSYHATVPYLKNGLEVLRTLILEESDERNRES